MDHMPSGRGAEHAVLRGYLERPTSVIVAGAPGVGKTRLARVVMAELAQAGRPGHWLPATRSSRQIPLGALGPLLPCDHPRAGMTRGPFEIAQEVRRAVTGKASSTLPLLAVDDAHLLDELSAMVLHQLAVSGAAVVLATVRTGEETPDALTALWKDGWAERVELQPLSRTETDELTMSLLGGACGPFELHAVWEASRGFPLYVQGMVRAAKAEGVLVQEDGWWRLRGPVPAGARLTELIKLRIDRLPEAARNDLDVVALAEPVPIEVISGCTSADGLLAAEKSGLVSFTAESGQLLARLAHPLFGQVVRSLMPTTRRRRLAARLADLYATAGLRHREDLLRCAGWKLESGETGPPEKLLSSALEAIGLLDYRLAERLARAAQPQGITAALILAEALYRQRRFAEAVAELEKVEPAGDQRIDVAIAKAKALWFGLDATGAAEAVLAAAEATATSEASAKALASCRARFRSALGFPSEALSLAAGLASDPAQEPAVTLAALGAVATASAFAGRVGDALTAARRWREPPLAAVSRSHELPHCGAAGAWVAVFLAGDVQQTGATGRTFLELGLQRHDAQLVATGSATLGWAALLEGNMAAAARHLREGWEVLRHADWAGTAVLAGAGLAQALCFSGHTAAARSVLSQTNAVRRAGLHWFDPLLAMATAWTDAADGHVSGAIGQLLQVACAARERGQFPYEAHALHAMARLGAAAQATRRLEALAGITEGPFAPVAAAHAAAIASSDAVGLEAAAGDCERAGFRLLAAEATAMAARRYHALGERTRVLALGQRCQALLAACPGALSPVIAAQQSPSVLTARELEVARMAAAGHSSRQIAGQLAISVRTVETHLDRAYAKLAIASRRDLAAALGMPSASLPGTAPLSRAT